VIAEGVSSGDQEEENEVTPIESASPVITSEEISPESEKVTEEN